MTKTITVAGKGGTGKTVVSALLVKFLSQKGVVLAVDADPSENLHLALGVDQDRTVGRVREEMAQKITNGTYDQTIDKSAYLEGKVMESLVEGEKFDLLAMGRPEGPGCYCAANHMLRHALDHLAESYDYVVVDCEAGMEHISRQTTRNVDYLIIMSDPTMKGIATAESMKGLIGDLRTMVGEIGFVINRAHGKLSPKIEEAIEKAGLQIIAIIPDDPKVAEVEGEGEAIVTIPSDSTLARQIKTFADSIIAGKKLS